MTHPQRLNGFRGVRGLGITTGIPQLDIVLEVYAIAARISPLVIRTVPLPDHIDTVRQAFLVLKDAEESSIATANAYIARHNSGRMLREEYAEYDGLRHDLHNAQVKYHGALRQACYDSLGQTMGDQAIARVPWPGWLPRLEGQMAPIALNGLGIAPIAIAAIAIAVIATIALLVHEVTKFVDSTADAYVAHAQATTLQRVIDMRERTFNQCVAQGGTPDDCTARSIALTADLAALVREIHNRHRRERVRRIVPAVIGSVVLGGLVAGGVYLWRKHGGTVRSGVKLLRKHAESGGVSGLGKTRRRRKKHAAGGKKKRRRARGLGAAQRLTSLRDPVPSRYMLEV